MNEELREILKKAYEEAAKKCFACKHKCFIYVFTTYINENGYEYFEYQMEHDSLPVEVQISYARLINALNIKNKDFNEGDILAVLVDC